MNNSIFQQNGFPTHTVYFAVALSLGIGFFFGGYVFPKENGFTIFAASVLVLAYLIRQVFKFYLQRENDCHNLIAAHRKEEYQLTKEKIKLENIRNKNKPKKYEFTSENFEPDAQKIIQSIIKKSKPNKVTGQSLVTNFLKGIK